MAELLDNFQSHIEALPYAAIILKQNNEIKCFNKKAQSYLGLKKKKHSGKDLVKIINDPVITEFLSSSNIPDKIAQGAQIISPYNEDLILTLSLLPYPDGARLLLAKNVSKTHRINKMRKDFVANVSHELRTPITVIKGYLETLLENTNEKDRFFIPIKSMQEQSQRMEKLVEDLLLLSKLESNFDKPNKAELINVSNMLRSLIKDSGYINNIKNHKMIVKIDDDLLIYGDESELQSAFSNIINNAIRYTPENGEIIIEWYKKNKFANFSVYDNGEGIESKHLHRLTERFYRVDKGRSRMEGGTGLGLSIVKHIMNRHNAELLIKSKPGKGNTFICQFVI